MMQNVTGGEVNLTNITAWRNVSNDGPGAIDQFQAEASINNSIFWDHGDGNPIGDFSMDQNANHSLVENLAGGTNGNLDGTNPANTPDVVRLPDLDADDFGDLRMQEGSPTIGQGNNDLLPADEFDIDNDGDTTETLPLDLNRNPRIQESTVDLGPYEFFVAFTVTASVVSGEGSIMPEEQIVAEGETASFTITPEPSWLVDDVIGDSCTPVLVSGNNWEATNIQADCTVQASFKADPDEDAVFADRFETNDE